MQKSRISQFGIKTKAIRKKRGSDYLFRIKHQKGQSQLSAWKVVCRRYSLGLQTTILNPKPVGIKGEREKSEENRGGIREERPKNPKKKEGILETARRTQKHNERKRRDLPWRRLDQADTEVRARKRAGIQIRNDGRGSLLKKKVPTSAGWSLRERGKHRFYSGFGFTFLWIFTSSSPSLCMLLDLFYSCFLSHVQISSLTLLGTIRFYLREGGDFWFFKTLLLINLKCNWKPIVGKCIACLKWLKAFQFTCPPLIAPTTNSKGLHWFCSVTQQPCG